jgi:phenylacetate-coenzyme A ligase PaaK-like adenylate-forming protein
VSALRQSETDRERRTSEGWARRRDALRVARRSRKLVRLYEQRARLPRRRIASILAHGPAHMSARVPMSPRAPIYRRLRLAATMPIAGMVSALSAFRPDVLFAFPSNAALLADEQRSGRLSISPTTVAVTAAECTLGIRARIAAAWSLQPFDIYATTETGPAALECEAHSGMHILEDRVILEPVDGKLLVTNLLNLVQPIIRYELTDRVTIDPSPCRCGHAGTRIAAIEGRSDDGLHFPDASGRLVPGYPSHFQEAIELMAGVRDYQITQLEGHVEVAVVATRDVTASIAGPIRQNLDALGVGTPVKVFLVDEIDRPPTASGKPKRVVARPRDAVLGEAEQAILTEAERRTDA